MMETNEITGKEIDKYTVGLVNLALKIATAAIENQKQYFIGGGFAIEFSVGQITRNHHDIDFHPMLSDKEFWIDWFKKKGFKVRKRADPKFPETYQIKDKDKNPVVDMWPFRLENGALLINCEGKYADSGRHWEEVRSADYRGVEIKIENPERVLDQKIRHAQRGQELRKQDLHDFKLLGREPLI